jgi:hypothetical protein
MALDVAGPGTVTFVGARGQKQPATDDQERGGEAKEWKSHSKSASLISMASADSNPAPNLGYCLVDYLDCVDSMTAFVVRSLAELIARIH